MSRASYVMTLCRLMGWPTQGGETGSFEDNQDPQKWYYGAIEEAFARGVLTRQSTLCRHIIGDLCRTKVKLYQTYQSIVDNAYKLGAYALAYHCHALGLDATDAVCLDVDLVGNRLRTHDAPCCSIVVQFLGEERTALLHHSFKLFARVHYIYYIYEKNLVFWGYKEKEPIPGRGPVLNISLLFKVMST
jgi:hypothetical protein